MRPRAPEASRRTIPAGSALALAAALALPALAHAAPPEAALAVPYPELVAAMRECRGYDVLATTNGARLQAEVLLRLARAAAARNPDGPPLLVGHEEWFRAVLEVAGISAERAPLFVRLAREHHQDVRAEYRAPRVVREMGKGPRPAAALAVTIAWPDGPGAERSYSYDDLLSTPHLKVTNARVMHYDLVDFGDVVVFDDIRGLTGRPTSGALGLLFQIIGEGRVVEYRMAVAPDGRVVSRGRARKAFLEVATTLTVLPDGRSEKGVPAEPALRAIEARLRAPLALRYVE